MHSTVHCPLSSACTGAKMTQKGTVRQHRSRWVLEFLGSTGTWQRDRKLPVLTDKREQYRAEMLCGLSLNKRSLSGKCEEIKLCFNKIHAQTSKYQEPVSCKRIAACQKELSGKSGISWALRSIQRLHHTHCMFNSLRGSDIPFLLISASPSFCTMSATSLATSKCLANTQTNECLWSKTAWYTYAPWVFSIRET